MRGDLEGERHQNYKRMYERLLIIIMGKYEDEKLKRMKYIFWNEVGEDEIHEVYI